MSNTSGVLQETGTTCNSHLQASGFTNGFFGGSVLLIFLVFCAWFFVLVGQTTDDIYYLLLFR
jgi:hypothetical protein